jgi:hypothetical protein
VYLSIFNIILNCSFVFIILVIVDGGLLKMLMPKNKPSFKDTSVSQLVCESQFYSLFWLTLCVMELV